MGEIVPIAYVPAGEMGTVEAIDGAPDQVRRLEEMGLAMGATVQMVSGGSPCIVKVRDSQVCIRGTNELQVLIRLGGAPNSGAEPT